MKTKEQILFEIKESRNSFKAAIVSNTENILAFFEKYPQYDFLTADEVFFILAAMKNNSVKVYDFGSGKIGFVGDILDEKNAPIAGEFPLTEEDFLNEVETGTVIEELVK